MRILPLKPEHIPPISATTQHSITMAQINLNTSEDSSWTSFTSRMQQVLSIFGLGIILAVVIHWCTWQFSVTFCVATIIVGCLAYTSNIIKMLQRANRVAHVAPPVTRRAVQPAAVSLPKPAVQQPRPSPPGNMVTLLSRVNWYDSAKGFGCVVPFEAGRPEVFVTQGVVKTAGIATLRGGMHVMVTFDATSPKPKALVLQLKP